MENDENIVVSTDEIDSANAVAYDYYDTYYNQVLQKLTSIEENEQTIIYNQEQLQQKHDDLIEVTACTSIIICILLVFTFIKSILHF